MPLLRFCLQMHNIEKRSESNKPIFVRLYLISVFEVRQNPNKLRRYLEINANQGGSEVNILKQQTIREKKSYVCRTNKETTDDIRSKMWRIAFPSSFVNLIHSATFYFYIISEYFNESFAREALFIRFVFSYVFATTTTKNARISSFGCTTAHASLLVAQLEIQRLP